MANFPLVKKKKKNILMRQKKVQNDQWPNHINKATYLGKVISFPTSLERFMGTERWEGHRKCKDKRTVRKK